MKTTCGIFKGFSIRAAIFRIHLPTTFMISLKVFYKMICFFLLGLILKAEKG